MGRHNRPIRAWKLPEAAPVRQGQAAAAEAALDQTRVRELGALPCLLPLLEGLGIRSVVNQCPRPHRRPDTGPGQMA